MNKILILFFAANPTGMDSLALDREAREIKDKIRASELRDALELVTQWAVRPDDLLQALNEYKPTIVHFSGHGTDRDELVLMDKNDEAKPVSKEALAFLFSTLRKDIRVVFLNACYSRPQAEAIVEHVDCAIGMNTEVGDLAAITFAASFYRALGFGSTVQEAFDQGKVALLLEGIPEEQTPQLLYRKGIKPTTLQIVGP